MLVHLAKRESLHTVFTVDSTSHFSRERMGDRRGSFGSMVHREVTMTSTGTLTSRT
jgi:hypothetical protein